MNKNGKLDIIFHLICLCIAFGLAGRCIQQYMLDDDVTQVEYTEFHDTPKSIYPSVTYCIKWPIHPTWGKWGVIWEQYGDKDKNAIRKAYVDYVDGKDFNETYANIDYDEVTTKLEKYLISIVAELEENRFLQWGFVNGTLALLKAYTEFKDESNNNIRTEFTVDEMNKLKLPKFSIVYRAGDKKCYSFDPPLLEKDKIYHLRFDINPEMLPGYTKEKPIQPMVHQKKQHFSLLFHYPYQNLKALSNDEGFISNIASSKRYARKYFLTYIEILRRRSKPNSLCISDKYDEKIIQDAATSVGCKTPVIKIENNKTKICKSREKYATFQMTLFKKEHDSPCESIRSISLLQAEEDQSDWIESPQQYKGRLVLEIYFQDTFYKEIIYVKAYTIESLIGNTGGYIGRYLKELQRL